MPTRIEQRFATLKTADRRGLVTFVTAGDPQPDATVALMQALVRGGADVVELGIPFSDPMADGPIIQRASERALRAGQTLRRVLDNVAEFRRGDRCTPVVVMGYLNPIERMGYAEFARSAAAAGVDGALIVDLPPEEANEVNEALRSAGLNQIFLVAPNSSSERIERVCRSASGFVYYVSVKGVTGDKTLDPAGIGEQIRHMRRHTALPIGIGFGVKNAAAAAVAGAIGDAVIVGSALVEIIEQAQPDAAGAATELERFVAELRAAIDAGSAVTRVEVS